MRKAKKRKRQQSYDVATVIEGIPMTRLANRIIRKARDMEESLRCQLSRDAAIFITPSSEQRPTATGSNQQQSALV